MHHLEIRTLQNTPLIHQPPLKVLIVQFVWTTNTFSSASVEVQHQRQRLGSGTPGFPCCIGETHPHKDTATGKTSSNRDNYKTPFLCGYSMWIKSGNHTGSMYDTWVILQYSIYTVAVSGEMTNVNSLLLAPSLASYSQLCLCVDECEQTFLRAERQKASVQPFSALETHCGGSVAWCLLPCPVSGHMLLSL